MYKILIIEDDQEDSEMLRRNLESSREGRFSVTEASNEEAFSCAIRENTYDYHFVDYVLPGWTLRDGGRVVKAILETNPHAVVSLLTDLAPGNLNDAVMELVLDGRCRVIRKSSLKTKEAGEIVLRELGLEFRVLIVEDDPTYQMLLAEYLRSTPDQRIDVVVEDNIRSALDRMGNRTFDAYIFDYQIPPGTAMTLLEAMPEAEFEKPVVITTSHDPQNLSSDLVELATRGHISFLSKRDLSEKALLEATLTKKRKPLNSLMRLLRGRH